MKKLASLIAVAALSAGFAATAHAHVSIGVGIGIPVAPAYPVYAPPPPVYYAPPPPVYYSPPPVYYSPPPVVVGGYWGRAPAARIDSAPSTAQRRLFATLRRRRFRTVSKTNRTD
jgi:hypothetical protein